MRNLNAFHLNGLRAVEAVARCGSLQNAAEELGVSPSAVSQQVGRTEKQFGHALFERTSSGIRPTPFGRDFAARLTAGFREISGAVDMARRTTADTLVISVAPSFASKWLLPRLSRHFDRYPQVLLRIDASVRMADPGNSDVDVAIRMGRGDWPGVRAEKLLGFEVFPVCSPAMAAGLNSVADLARLTEIADENAMFSWAPWFAAAGAEPVRLLPGARFSDPMLALDAVVAGHGVMLAWHMIAADALADGRLVAPFGVRAPVDLAYYLVTAAGLAESRNVRNFKTWLREEVEATMARFDAHAAWQGKD
jgi:DNA-binding transcriptional LysR family regulator